VRILQLNFEKTWRGGERQTLYCMQAFRRAGHEVELLARAGYPLAERAAADGFRVHARRGVPGQLAFLAARGRSYDIVHSQTANTLTWAVLTKPLHGRPVVFSRRTSLSAAGHERTTGFKWRHADLFVAISHMAASESIRLGLRPVIIRSAIEDRPVDAARTAEFVQRFGLAGRKVLATSAALIHDKDPQTLVRAVGELARRRDDFVFIHLGGGGNAEAEARGLVESLGLQSVYVFAGFQQGIEDFYPAMDVFVMASKEEALGSSVFDAFLRRVPVVSTDAGGLKESLADGRGILCPTGDHQALARGMERALDDQELRQAMVERAYDYVRREHDVDIMGGRYLEQFQALLAARAR